MNRLQIRYERGCRWDNVVTPFVLKKLNTVKEESRQCKLWVAGCNQFQVQDKNTLYTVSLDTWTCDCGVWEVIGIPCRHATLAIAHKRDKLESFTHPSFSKENYMKAYSHMIQAIPDPQFWPPMTLAPATILHPPLKRLPGRPRVNRRREVGEDGAVKRSGPIKCSKCFGLGHNTRTCQRAPVRQRKKRRSSQQDSVPQGSQQADMAGGSTNLEVVVDIGNGSRGRMVWRSTRGRGRRGNKSAAISTTRGMRRGINTPIAPRTRREEGQTSNISETMTLGSQPGLTSVSSTQDTQM
ncbi:hypothetical protein Salat_2571800 [Sesamum alatum]|uniref:SWIM-type domain-containing protein n=1 Tax=Sesamum alatum TaxID=300844 RepID=A0AAE1XTQ9_9LAMI|nr:hypothetical protein Salat_2571800 [Sesamum alatum]